MLKVGIVGLPNVGKSSLFNALTSAGAPSENYPFCTVEPNVGTVEIPDPRLDLLHEAVSSKTKVPDVMYFVDIAGLVEGASQGEGLGNQFLGNIREVDAVAHVLRCFEDPDVTHVLGSVDPVRDQAIVETELILADLDSVEKRLDKVQKKARSGEMEAQRELAVLKPVHEVLAEGFAVRTMDLSDEDLEVLKAFHLLTAKPVIYVANIMEGALEGEGSEFTRQVAALAEAEGARWVPLCSKVEAELAELEPEDRVDFLAEMGMDEPGLHRFVRESYTLLGLLTFFTVGEKESRAWAVAAGSKAPQAAGTIHSDFERGFIRSETIGYAELLEYGSLKAAKEAGRVRSEGRDYDVVDGDVMLFRFNV